MKQHIGILWALVLAAFPLLLWWLPADFFDQTGLTVCPSKLLFHWDCLGCGMTRAVMHLHHFQWQAALGFNRGVVVAYPALLLVWGNWMKNALVGAKLFGNGRLEEKA